MHNRMFNFFRWKMGVRVSQIIVFLGIHIFLFHKMVKKWKNPWSWLISSYSKQLAQQVSLWSSKVGFWHLTQQYCFSISLLFRNKNIVGFFIFCRSLAKQELNFLIKSRWCLLIVFQVTEKVTGEKQLVTNWVKKRYKIKNKELLTCNKSTRFL